MTGRTFGQLTSATYMYTRCSSFTSRGYYLGLIEGELGSEFLNRIESFSFFTNRPSLIYSRKPVLYRRRCRQSRIMVHGCYWCYSVRPILE